MQPFFSLIQKLKRSSAENSRRPETLAVKLSLSLLRRLSLSLLSLSRATLSLSSPAPCGGGGDRISISSPLSLVSRSGSRSRLRWSVSNPTFFHDSVYSYMLELGVIGSSRTGMMSRLSLGFDVCGNE
ncbi:hypothetical protein F2Q69_00028651 [Brassica cretica]|uniref:Uncharacterized protein n=1 Tax=Brassica cretica TaxID=69181 RepID=A0A8S9RRR7_BRACR|nr:hypothetical protein F2Q69_00028651 [Brassica cretica]